MGYKEILSSITGGLMFADTQIASSSTIVRSPIGEAVKQLSVNPQLKKIGNYEYIKFGSSDDIPEVLEALLGKSSTHAGIIGKKAAMVSGKNLDFGGKRTEQKGAKSIEWTVFKDNAGGTGISLDSLWKSMSFIYAVHGSVGIILSKEGGNIVKIEAVSPRNFRMEKPDNKGDIKAVIKRDVFKVVSGGVFSNKEERITMFSEDNKDKRQFIYIKNPKTTNQFYGIPNYIGAFNFIEADYEFGVTIKNSAENGFSPKVLATFIGRNVSEEEKSAQAERFKDNFQGSDREQVVVSWVRRKEDAPEFKALDISNLDKTIDVMARLNDSKILTAHSVTNPTLFGVTIAGRLGNSGTELESSYLIFRESETLPDRELLLDALRMIFRISQFADVQLSVVDTPISIQATENRGGDQTSDEDNADVKK